MILYIIESICFKELFSYGSVINLDNNQYSTIDNNNDNNNKNQSNLCNTITSTTTTNTTTITTTNITTNNTISNDSNSLKFFDDYNSYYRIKSILEKSILEKSILLREENHITNKNQLKSSNFPNILINYRKSYSKDDQCKSVNIPIDSIILSLNIKENKINKKYNISALMLLFTIMKKKSIQKIDGSKFVNKISSIFLMKELEKEDYLNLIHILMETKENYPTYGINFTDIQIILRSRLYENNLGFEFHIDIEILEYLSIGKFIVTNNRKYKNLENYILKVYNNKRGNISKNYDNRDNNDNNNNNNHTNINSNNIHIDNFDSNDVNSDDTDNGSDIENSTLKKNQFNNIHKKILPNNIYTLNTTTTTATTAANSTTYTDTNNRSNNRYELRSKRKRNYNDIHLNIHSNVNNSIKKRKLY